MVSFLGYKKKMVKWVFLETLRLHSPAAATKRVCSKDYTIPGETTIIEKGTTIMVSIFGIHHDPEFYPEPKIFNPDRFSNENKRNRPNYSFLPFSQGNRNCIGIFLLI